MRKYIIRLDDASEKRDIEKWNRVEALLDKYDIKPLVGVIPECRDIKMKEYPVDDDFWDRVHLWEKKGWSIALHGCYHAYTTKSGGVNPINARSEFAGEPLNIQKERIRYGKKIFDTHNVNSKVFFAPAHTFDDNTIIALKEETDIRIISDTIASKPYNKNGITYVPQQPAIARLFPISVATVCYHPNTMTEEEFNKLESFCNSKVKRFIAFPTYGVTKHKTLYDVLLNKTYFFLNKLLSLKKGRKNLHEKETRTEK